MKTRPLLMFLTTLLFATLTLSAAERQKWQTDWTEFGKQLTPLMEKPGVIAQDIDRVFDGKQVEWEGEVAKISDPDTILKFGRIVMKMTPIRLTNTTGSAELSEIYLAPQDDKEWKSWAGIKVGTRVVYRTTLKNAGLPGLAVVWVFTGAGPNAGQVKVIVSTEGATMVRSISPEEKKQK